MTCLKVGHSETYTSNGSRVSRLRSWTTLFEVDGKILIDVPDFGPNGFYLPFDPAAQGVNYTAGIVSTLVNATQVYGTFTGGGFDGRAGDLAANASNLFGSQTTGSQSGNLVVPINKSYSSSIKMYGYQNTNGTITLRIDGVDYNSGLGTSVNGKNLPLTTISGIPASGTLESITVTQSNFTGATGFTGIYLMMFCWLTTTTSEWTPAVTAITLPIKGLLLVIPVRFGVVNQTTWSTYKSLFDGNFLYCHHSGTK